LIRILNRIREFSGEKMINHNVICRILSTLIQILIFAWIESANNAIR